jgi:hypothetical protein
MDRKKYKKRDGVSLLIGLGLVFAIMFFALLVGNVVVSSVRQSANVNRANEAYYGAEGALEQGLLHNYNEGIGFTSGEMPVTYTGSVEAKYKIEGQVPEGLKYGSLSAGYNGMYGIPTPGTGNVATECDPLNPPIDESGVKYKGDVFANEDVADHPCNWNKIKVGQSVTVPLYRINADGSPQNLFDNADQNLILRVRTPCKDGSEMCLKADRASFNWWSDSGDEPDDDPIISWSINGLDDLHDEQSIVLNPYLLYDFNDEFHNESTIISEKKIFLVQDTDQIVLDESTHGEDLNVCKGYISEFLNNQKNTVWTTCGSTFTWDNQQIEKPVLKFTIINTLVDDVNSLIPNLEYQLLTSSDLAAPPTNVSQTIKAEGISGTFKQVLEVKQPQESGLLEYVIQQ